MHFRTRAIHVGQERDKETGAVVPPIHVASTFVQPGAGVWGEFDYSRSGNPTRKSFERAIADLEGGVGGLITFLVKDADWRATADVIDRVRIPRIGPSLGGVESLIEQPLIMSYYETPPDDRHRFGIPDNMIRMSCGIENPEDLIADLAQALDTTA